jgi:hypothetical protein
MLGLLGTGVLPMIGDCDLLKVWISSEEDDGIVLGVK